MKVDPKLLVEGIKARKRGCLARAITLVESSNPEHHEQAADILDALPPKEDTFRIGISGPPGVGKSSFIEAIGPKLIDAFGSLGILAVDPTSPVHGGSILGDKTRMTHLANDDRCFIRPSPAGNNLGGVALKTRESISLLEAYGFESVLVETVGVGQSEHLVHSMVDCLIMLQLPNAGDELQGIKKGILEVCDLLIVHKDDGTFKHAATASKLHHQKALHLVGKNIPILSCSSLTGTGLDEVCAELLKFASHTKKSGLFASRREQQTNRWFKDLSQESLNLLIARNKKLTNIQNDLLGKVQRKEISIFSSAIQWRKHLDGFFQQ